MPRLLLTLTSYPPAVGGAQIHAHLLAQQLQERGDYDIRVATQWSSDRRDWLLGTTVNAPGGSNDYLMDGIQVHQFGLNHRQKLRLAPYALLFHTCQGWAIDRISDVLASKLAERTLEVDLIENVRIGRESLSFASLKLARRLDVPFVLRPLHHPRWGGVLHRHYQRLYRQADGLVALTDWEKDTLIQFGVDPARICVVGSGPVVAESHDPSRFRTSHGLDSAPIVLFLGQKYPYKGLKPLLRAMAAVWRRYPDCRLVAIGPRTKHSKRLIRGINDSRVVELGSVTLQDKTDALSACSLLCVPSAQESFGGVYTEAWALGKPVIGGPAPALHEVITHGEDGLLVTQEPKAVSEAILELLDDPERGSALGARGQTKVAQRFTWERLASKLAGFHAELL